ncbi:MAG TPA: N-acetylmuramoyl-L-alanine amidase [Nevskiaceae bacterium]|nr:N-acetylmuramoyl-L-alanine amidase [Nevskiaceae bacterium]
MGTTLLSLRQRLRQGYRSLAAISATAVLLLAVGSPAIASAAQNSRQAQFNAAAQEFGVPASLLLAVSYNQSRWTPHGNAPSNDNGYGLMNLRTKIVAKVQDGRGDPKRPVPAQATIQATHYTLDDAATLLGVSPDMLKNSDQQNIRGGAAVLADYAKKLNNNTLPGNLGDWYSAVVDYSSATDPQAAQGFADDVYATIQTGASLTTTDGQALSIAADATAQPNRATASALSTLASPLAANGNAKAKSSNQNTVDCPRSLHCQFIPARYAQNSTDPADYGNYDPANRPKDMKIKYIVIHDTEGSYQSAIDWFQNPASYVSCNYVIRSNDGAVTEMVRPKDVSWCAGDWYVNMHSINIEHEGFSAQGTAWYTEAMYRSSAKLVRYLADKYNIPLDRQHIVGHDNVPTLSPARLSGQHTDPGPYWDWNHYMDLLQAGDTQGPDVTADTKVLTISPNFATNRPPIADCSTTPCTTLPSQSANRVYLHAQPYAASPLLSDPYKHPDNAPGTTNIEDWSASATAGDKFAVAGQEGDWTGIWFGGKVGWLYNPHGGSRVAHASSAKVITSRKGLSSIPVYGGAYPESSAYPATIPDQSLTPLYTIPAGQKYVVGDKRLSTDYFYAATFDSSLPDDHAIVHGNQKYYQISFNHRFVYVKANDVDVRSY